ncbi:MAG: transmembrane fusion protein [Desulfobacteraceae bacterium]|nr:transmembrane fusion protein [Desulfobacteraceae bacterium]
MDTLPNVTQDPVPGESMVWYCGDCIRFVLTLSHKSEGEGWIRTNLGSAAISRKETIKRVEKSEIKLDEAWYDIKMLQKDDLTFEVVLPLNEIGHFAAKCFFLPKNSAFPIWPEGKNFILNVEPAGTCCANIIYNAFVRQFGRSKTSHAQDDQLSSTIEAMDEKGYTVIPESGKFRDLKKEIDFIFNTLGCRVLHLLPIHPTPTTFARMGRFGSPYAALNFTEVDPALAEFDPSATPLEQFMELADAVHFHNGYLFMDIAINHTGWAASIHESHPEWLVRGEDGKIEAPGAWGVIWADLTKLDYSNIDLWQYMADIFLLWCRRGVDGFRCDAGYMIPVNAWEYIVDKVRLQFPETLFFLEGLGGPIKTTCDILGKANFNWAYSELFQNYDREQISSYLPGAYDISSKYGHTIHFAETHDNNRLASESQRYAKMRTSLSALFSVCGGFGFANGVEWFATEKIDVHEAVTLNWKAKENQVDHIGQLNTILKYHPCFFDRTKLKLIQKNQSNCLVLLRNNVQKDIKLLILVNLDCENTVEALWHQGDAQMTADRYFDLLTGAAINVEKVNEDFFIRLSPGEVLVLSDDISEIETLQQHKAKKSRAPERVLHQKFRDKVLKIHTVFNGYTDVSRLDVDKAALKLAADPLEFIRSCNHNSKEAGAVVFHWDRDVNRQVMVPPGFFLVVMSPSGFRAQLIDKRKQAGTILGYEEGLPINGNKGNFAVFSPLAVSNQHRELQLNLRVLDKDGTRRETAPLLYLAPCESLVVRSSFSRKEIVQTPYLKLLGTTNKGGMMRAAAWWGKLDSRYDAILGANLSSQMPENRWMVLSRLRIWGVYQGYSRELAPDCLVNFNFSYDNTGRWRFHIPTSEGKYYVLELILNLDTKENRVILNIKRTKKPPKAKRFLADSKPVNIIIRPDIEDRSFHETVKAFEGAETAWPDAIEPQEDAFFFQLSTGKILSSKISNGKYIHEPEWHYMIHRPFDAHRGLDAESDLFSPGYFLVSCKGNQQLMLHFSIGDSKQDLSKVDQKTGIDPTNGFEKEYTLQEAVNSSLLAFIVTREKHRSVIAGYPWFLDWGRDSLIFCRALIELERFSEARGILRLFGQFENNGTLPNMICGKDAQNIETSDAPLWFITCCKELVQKQGNHAFLEEQLENRTIKDIILSIANSLIKGTTTGVVADHDTLLLYSPSHFTWMDTNYPAGSPRQGYPVEIQALWYNALCFIKDIESKAQNSQWSDRAKKVKKAINELYYLKELGFFSDCLHCSGPVGAKHASADDALRPNQLFLITMGIITDKLLLSRCVETCMELIVPGGIRSLADRRVSYPLAIYHQDELVKDPHFPYSGVYKGDEDSQRKPAYHNGTAWTWPFPVFCEAWAIAFGKKSHSTALALLGSVIHLMRKGAAGYIPEILDGDYPHTPRGCDAQAWGSSEVARVMHKLLSP